MLGHAHVLVLEAANRIHCQSRRTMVVVVDGDRGQGHSEELGKRLEPAEQVECFLGSSKKSCILRVVSASGNKSV